MSISGRWFASLSQDVRFALRLMRRNLGFSAIAIITLALGIGANTAVYSLLDAVLLHPLPYPEPDRLFMLWTVEGKSQRGHNTSYPDFDEWRKARSFEAMGAFHGASYNMTGGPEAERVSAIACTPGLLEALGIQPALGRSIADRDDRHVAVITHALWLRRFGGEPSVAGKTLRLDGASYTVVGVLPRGFHFEPRMNREPDLFVPLEPVRSRTSWFLRVIGRVRSGVSPAQAQAEMNGIAARIVQANPTLDRRQGIRVDPMHRYVVQDARRTGLLLLGAVAFLLLVACVNVANLLLSMCLRRDREVAIRLAIGASRGRLVRQMLTESALVAAVGGALGLVVAYVSLPVLAGLAPERTSFLTRVQDNGVRVDFSVLCFTAAVSMLAAVLFGLLPALKATRQAVSSAARASAGRAPGALVALEIALSFVLLVGGALMLNSLWRLLDVDPGFRTENLLTMAVSLPDTKYADEQSQAAYFRRAVDRLGAVPGVRAADAVASLPMSLDYSLNGLQVEGPPAREGRAYFNEIGATYFATMGIPILQGRGFTDADHGSAPPVAIVNASMARRFWPGRSPLGQAIVVSHTVVRHTADGMAFENLPRRVEVVGVAADVRQQWLGYEAWPELYMPFEQRGVDSMTFVVRTDGAASPQLVARARDAVARVDPDIPVTDVKTMDEWIRAGTAATRFVFALIGLFALVALLLAAVGIYAVVAHSVARRTREIAIRLSLGARPGQVLALVMQQHLGWIVAGVIGGVAGASALTRLLANQLYDVKPTDLATYAAAALLLGLVAVIADIVPAWRARRVMPAQVLRHE